MALSSSFCGPGIWCSLPGFCGAESHRAAINVSAVVQSSQGLHREDPAPELHHTIIIWLLVGFSFSRDVGPRASATHLLLTTGHPWLLAMWFSLHGVTSQNLLHQSSKQEEPESKCKQDRSHCYLEPSIRIDILNTFKKKLTTLDFASLPTNIPCSKSQSKMPHCI